MGDQKKRKWTVFFIIKAPDADISAVIEMLNEIRNIPLNNHLSIVFCIQMLKENKEAMEKGDTESMVSKIPTSTQTPTTFFYSLATPINAVERVTGQLNLIGENQKFDLTDPDFLEDYFQEVIMRPFKAQRYLLFTFDHGNAFGIFNSFDDPSPGLNVLTMEELNTALRWILGNKKVDVAIMMNCYAQSIMAGFALRKSVKYLVAPESYMWFAGYNYVFIFNVLMANLDISGKKLAKYAVSSFPKKVYPDFKGGEDDRARTKLFATKLKYYNLLPAFIDQLVEYLLNIKPFPKEALNEARKSAQFAAGKGLADFYFFLKSLEQQKIFEQQPLIAGQLCSLMELMVIEGYVGDLTKDQKGKVLYHGPSVYFPSKLSVNDGNENDEDTLLKLFMDTEFANKTRWKELANMLI